jgi:hypothetical protein
MVAAVPLNDFVSKFIGKPKKEKGRLSYDEAKKQSKRK